MNLARRACQPAVAAILLVCAALVLASAIAATSRDCTPPQGKKKRPVAASGVPPAKPAEVHVPFRAGEKLDYRILWSKFFVNAATVRLAVIERRPFHGKEAWHFQAQAHTIDTMRLLFPLDDQFDSYSEPGAMVGLQYEMYLREQGKEQNSVFRMTSEGTPAPSSGSAVRVLPGTRDPFGLVFFLRAVDWQRSREVQCPVFDGKKLYEVMARLELERGEARVPAGTYAASRIEVRVFERGAEVPQTRFWLWLAQDATRTPVLVEAEIPFGSARVELTRAE